MTLDALIKNKDWTQPVFKILANNDTGNAPGHQGGIVIPAALRYIFPPLNNSTSATRPTIDQRVDAQLYVENLLVANVNTRYQYQTWGGARSPESRITDQLGPLRNLAKGGDILLIQKSRREHFLYRLVLIKTTSEYFQEISTLTANRRWGELWAANLQEEQAGVDEPTEPKIFDIPTATTIAENSGLPHWAAVAYVTRCARRFLECYTSDNAEPKSQRSTVLQAVELAEMIVVRGGPASDFHDQLILDGQYFDQYDLIALKDALQGCANAAESTYEDLKDDRLIERFEARKLTAISLAKLAFEYATCDLDVTIAKPVKVATDWCLWAESELDPVLISDLEEILKQVRSNELGPESPYPYHTFGELWSSGRPATWPAAMLSFRPRARIIRTIGDKLVSGPEAAVIELVKNGYDADASYIRISFIPDPSQKKISQIIVEDNGHGMTTADIEQKWMEPATSDKRDRKLSVGGRRLLGSKGIGRFAASRLGQHLKLESTAVSINTLDDTTSRGRALNLHTTLLPSIDWEIFEHTKYLDDVSFKMESPQPKQSTGTCLTISSLKDEWNEQKVKKLHEELRKVVSPIPSSDQNQFQILIDVSQCTPENSNIDGLNIFDEAHVLYTSTSDSPVVGYQVRPYPLLDACDYSVEGIFDETGTFDGTITIQRGGLEPEKCKLNVPLQNLNGETQCGVVLVRLHIFDRESNAIRSTATKAGFGTIGIREARKILDSISGVAIYREGFRIRPYGDEENDWLALDAKRVQNPTLRIGRNQIAGVVTVDDEHSSQLIERSSREGLEENGSFLRLRSLISALLAEVVEPKRRKFRVNAGLESRAESNFREVYDRVQMGWSKLLVAKMPEEDRAAAEELISKESERLKQYVKRLEDRQAQLEARVTLGLIVGEVMHQGNTPLSFLETETSRLKKWWPMLLDGSTKAQARQAEIPRLLNGMDASGQKLRILFNALNPLSGARRGAPKIYDVLKVIEHTVYLFKSRIEKLGIEIKYNYCTQQSSAFGYEDDLATAVTNIVDNAIYWLDHHNISYPEIQFTLDVMEKKCKIRISDNGVGIPEEFSDQLFDIGFTLKPDGTGLGLSIAREAVFRSNGELDLISTSLGTAFEITLPNSQINIENGN